MSIAVSENIQEQFSKPPPKKKWLQNYIGQDSQCLDSSQQIAKLLGRQETGSSDKSQEQLTLSQDVIGGVVQGVIDQFQNYLDHGSSEKEENKAGTASPGRSEEPAPEEEEKLSQTDIAPVVQSVISQFLNGSLADSGFRRSRKRSHKHINSRSRDKCGYSYSSSASNIRKSSVIQYKGLHSEKSEKPSIKLRKLESLMSTKNQTKPMFSNQIKHTISKEEESSEALNLSCPKINAKVTFANEDRCYSIDSVKSFQESKSLKMFSLDYSKRIHENLQLIVAEEEDEAPLNLVNKEKRLSSIEAVYIDHSTPAIRLRGSPNFNQTSASPISLKSSEFSSLPNSRRTSPVELNAFSVPKIRRKDSTADMRISPTQPNPVPFAIVRPKPMRPIIENSTPSPHVLQDLISARSLKTNISPIDGLKITPSSSKAPELLSANTVQAPESRSGSRPSTREVHNRLEKNRRAQLKSCFNELATECDLDPAKASNLLVIRTAYKSIMTLRREEREQERTVAALVQEKIRRQARLAELRRQCACAGGAPDSDSDCAEGQ